MWFLSLCPLGALFLLVGLGQSEDVLDRFRGHDQALHPQGSFRVKSVLDESQAGESAVKRADKTPIRIQDEEQVQPNLQNGLKEDEDAQESQTLVRDEVIEPMKRKGGAKPLLPNHRLGGDQDKTVFDITISLGDRPECVADLRASPACSRVLSPDSHYRKNNLALIACLLSPDGRTGYSGEEPRTVRISKDCENIVWKYQVAITQNQAITSRITKACPDNAKALSSCFELMVTNTALNQGHILGCIIEKKNDPLVPLLESCRQVINQIEALVFSDYRLIGNFVETCGSDIETLHCGRIHNPEQSYHSQGQVIECLSDKTQSLTKPCRNEILRIAEFQSDDYHLDRRLFLACEGDRVELCSSAKAGDGRVYKCLMRHKMDPKLTLNCQKQLVRRQKLIAVDYQASRSLVKSCTKEIMGNRCRKNLTHNAMSSIRLSEVLLCLEDAARNKENVISPLCSSEMEAHRQMIMEDYRISPELIVMCRDEIQSLCASEGPGGNTIHCLMKQALERSMQSQDCLRAVKDLMKVSDVGSNWKVDPVLQNNCQDVVVRGCSSEESNQGILSCLLTLAGRNSHHMTKECAGTLMEIQYFLARDFTLSPKLYKKCRADADKFCHAEEDWHLKSKDPDQNSLAQSKQVFPCLVRYLYADEDENENNRVESDTELSDGCADEVERTLEQRAISVLLHPEIEENCREFLVSYCGDRTGPGLELTCLQDNFDNLDDECRENVRKYTKIEAKNTRLNTPIMTACHEVIESECKDELHRMDDGGIMHCLIQYKMEQGDKASNLMTRKCAVVVEHWQILTMKDWRFSAKFKEHCQSSVKEHCDPAPKTKLEVLACLSGIIQTDLMSRSKNRVPKLCRMELKFNLLQKHSDLNLNPNLAENCKSELESLCPDQKSLECLKKQPHESLSPTCRHFVFIQQKEEIMMNNVDPVLMKICGNEIKTHCSEQLGEPNVILNCLKENKRAPNFEPSCRKVVVHRIIQQMRDYRLNPRLQQACMTDLPAHCASVILLGKQNAQNDFLEGKVIDCLKNQYRTDKDTLTKLCKREITNLMRQASVDIRANPRIVDECPKSIDHCKESTNFDPQTTDDNGKMEECLKSLFVQKKILETGDSDDCIKEVAKIIEDEHNDINVDRALHTSCGLDLAKFCHDITDDGEKITCLKNVYEDSRLKLEPKCETLLGERLQMYNLALEVLPLQSVSQLLDQVKRSPNRNHFFLVALCLAGVILLIGIVCGRSTRRQKRELKTK